MVSPMVPPSTTTPMYRLRNIYGNGATAAGAVEDRSGMYRLRNVYVCKSGVSAPLCLGGRNGEKSDAVVSQPKVDELQSRQKILLQKLEDLRLKLVGFATGRQISLDSPTVRPPPKRFATDMLSKPTREPQNGRFNLLIHVDGDGRAIASTVTLAIIRRIASTQPATVVRSYVHSSLAGSGHAGFLKSLSFGDSPAPKLRLEVIWKGNSADSGGDLSTPLLRRDPPDNLAVFGDVAVAKFLASAFSLFPCAPDAKGQATVDHQLSRLHAGEHQLAADIWPGGNGLNLGSVLLWAALRQSPLQQQQQSGRDWLEQWNDVDVFHSVLDF